ncbi:MAG: HNH endonuclease [Gammaproteobacteria bacterium]|nr:HNH endonuclease [Gammaproteobacteria bacterium]
MRNPDWVREEVILAMDLYLRAGRKQLPPSHDEVVRLSQLLSCLPIHPPSLRDENFRNPNGISMILGNLLGIDPLHNQPGLSKNNQLQASIWKEFMDVSSLLHRTAEAIRAVASSEDLADSADSTGEECVFPEGYVLTRLHIFRERNRAAVDSKIDEVWYREGQLACEVCEFDFLEVYGEVGRRFAECHHTIPLADAAFRRKTRIADLAIVCANCHRMLHRARPVLIIEELKSLVARHKHTQYGGVS